MTHFTEKHVGVLKNNDTFGDRLTDVCNLPLCKLQIAFMAGPQKNVTNVWHVLYASLLMCAQITTPCLEEE